MKRNTCSCNCKCTTRVERLREQQELRKTQIKAQTIRFMDFLVRGIPLAERIAEALMSIF
ncbi:hypothetical protein MHI57_24880 [Cytobacillus sp. FSL K6-0129]|uniref:hypothetical protein n=1 Tax=Cytobacillus sp. FSL K6-0129 TaxID=2921421 RepID=UPI0030F77C7E